MPRAAMDYSKTNIYKIVCNDLNVTDCYVGHTTDMTKRKWAHKTACNNEKDKKHNLKIYQIIRENGGWDNWDMVLVEKFPCNDKYEACKRERDVYEKLDAKMNMVRPYLTQEEHKEKKKQYQKKYREGHKEVIAEKNKQYNQEHKQYREEYRQEHKEERKQYSKQHYQEHKEDIKQHSKQHYQEHKEQRKEHDKQYSKQYYQDHKKEITEKRKQYREEHKAEINENRKEKLKEKIECKYCTKRLTKGSMYSHLKICKCNE